MVFLRELLLISLVPSCFGLLRQQWSPFEKIFLGNDGEPRDRFGASVAIDGSTMAVGTDGDDDRDNDAGAVYVYNKQGRRSWELSQKLVPTDGELKVYNNDAFGQSVDLLGDTLVVGSPLREEDGGVTASDSGAAYVFERVDGEWLQTNILIADDNTQSDQFGFSVKIYSNDTLLVGSPGNGLGDSNTSGAVYVYEKQGVNTWTQTFKITPPDPTLRQRFGLAIATDRVNVLVGSPNDNDNGDSSGSAYLLTPDGAGSFTPVIKYLPNDGLEGDEFGSAVAIDNNTVAIGAQKDDDNFIGNDAGAVYMYNYNKDDDRWDLSQKITRTRMFNRLFRRQSNTFLGTSLSLDGDFLAVGATGIDRFPAVPSWLPSFLGRILRENVGRVYIYRYRSRRRRPRWIAEDLMGPCENPTGDSFGHAVALDMSQETLVVGSLEGGGRNANEENTGAVYVYERRGIGYVRRALCRLFYF